ncbi:MAG: dihydroorotase [Actinomycetota bacterium]|nr:dihydroorotase [Actinomycetota bacterium]
MSKEKSEIRNQKSEKLLIAGGRVIDPASGTDKVADVKIEDGVIVKDFSARSAFETIDAKGLIVTPGLIDMHVHLREPGREDEETIETGAQAAAAGGFTTIACMPNTSPPIDNRSVLEYVTDKAVGAAVNVKVVAAITAGLAGERLSEMGDLANAGAVGFSDDGRPVANSALMRLALEYSKVFDLPIISHAEDIFLSKDGVMHEGFISTQLGLKGIPAAAEETMIARDIILAELTGARLHITHVSTAGGVALIRAGKLRGIKITADVTPHHLVLTDENLKGYDTNYKVNPPLRTQADNVALLEGLINGDLDAIVSDHAPHAAQEKEQEIEAAPFGAIGLQTTVPVLLTHLLSSHFDLPALIGKLTVGPAGILGLRAGTLGSGEAADITLIDPKAKLKIEPGYFLSKSRNSAFIGSDLVGSAKYTIVGGRIVFEAGGRSNEG